MIGARAIYTFIYIGKTAAADDAEVRRSIFYTLFILSQLWAHGILYVVLLEYIVRHLTPKIHMFKLSFKPTGCTTVIAS